jgi:hypothetical protein
MLFICTNYNKWVLDEQGAITGWDVIIVEADDELDCLGKGQFPVKGEDDNTQIIEI